MAAGLARAAVLRAAKAAAIRSSARANRSLFPHLHKVNESKSHQFEAHQLRKENALLAFKEDVLKLLHEQESRYTVLEKKNMELKEKLKKEEALRASGEIILDQKLKTSENTTKIKIIQGVAISFAAVAVGCTGIFNFTRDTQEKVSTRTGTPVQV